MGNIGWLYHNPGAQYLEIVLLGLIGIYMKDFFYYFHVYIAQGILIAVALLLFFVWMSYAVEK